MLEYQSIKPGWIYTGTNYGGRSQTYSTESEAMFAAKWLKELYPDNDFDTYHDTRGGPGYDRWIVITNKDAYGREIPRKKSKSSKPKRKTCSCKKVDILFYTIPTNLLVGDTNG